MTMLKKWYEQEPVRFAVGWILLYVVVFANADQLSEALGTPKLITVFAGLLLSLPLWRFLQKNGLAAPLGLVRPKLPGRESLRLAPLILLSTVNLWNGLCLDTPLPELLLFLCSMCFVAFLEEVIFRGLLFRALLPEGKTRAILISSLTFGMGHMVNLLMGAPLADTLLQLVYASAVGFCYTAVALSRGSLLPCILSHGFINCTSALARQPEPGLQLILALVQTLLALGCGLWLLRRPGAPSGEASGPEAPHSP